MVVLLAHELGHYAVALHHGFRLSLPWFIPFPFFIGTLGAIIRLEAPPRGRTGLLEMGAAGPLAGFTAIVVLWSLRLAFGEAPNEVEGAYTLAAPWLWRVLGAMFAGSSTVPLSSADPVAFAGWIGCLVTAMNLLPIGQLDGGHIASALWPSWHQQVSYAVFAGLALLGFIWPGWWVWGLMIWLIGARHAVEVERPGPDVSRRAAWLAFGCAVCWVACFVPEPWAV